MRRDARRTWTGGAALGATLIIAAGAAAGPHTAALAAPGSPGVASLNPALEPYENQPVRWHRCRTGPDDPVGAYLDAAGAQCAEIRVPLDYAQPDGREITLGVSRVAAADTAHRRGILMINIGGPGGSALDFTPDFRTLLGPAGDRFDLIGMDPRFVGRSTPVDCGPGAARDWLRGGGPDLRSFERVAADQAAIARACSGRADVLAHASTRNTARDMDVVRAALGEPTTSYLGFSYGTYLGAVYMQMFPDRVDRFVLDSAVDPARYNPRVLRDAGPLLEGALRDWARWAARDDVQYGLGATADEVLATVDRIYEVAARRPLTVDGERYDASDIPALLLGSLIDGSEDAAANLAMGVRAFADAADGRTPATNPQLEEFLESDSGLGAAVDLPALERAAGPEESTGPPSAFQSAQLAILCGDVPASRIAGDYLDDIRDHLDREPHFATATWNIGPCAYWPVRPREAPTRVRNDVPALVVAAEKDNRTPYAHSQALHRALAGSRLVTLRDAQLHGVYGGRSGCVDDTVNAYLRDGVLPRGNLRCGRPPAPVGSPPE